MTSIAGPTSAGSLMLARQRQAFILDRVREDGAVRVADLVRELGVSDMTVRRDLEILDERGLLEKVHGGATSIGGHGPVRARVRGQVGAPAGARRTPSPMRRSRSPSPGMAVAVSAGTTTYALAQRLGERPGADRRDQLDPGRRRPSPGRPRRPDDHPDRRRPDAVGRAGRAVRRRRAPDASTSTSSSSASTGWTRGPGSPARTSSRPTRTGRSSRPAGGWSSSPTTRSGGSSASARSPVSTRPTSSSPTPGSAPRRA